MAARATGARAISSMIRTFHIRNSLKTPVPRGAKKAPRLMTGAKRLFRYAFVYKAPAGKLQY
jgi:hypothetical protein